MKYLLIFVLGFCTHKIINYTYDYNWERSFAICNGVTPLSEHFNCTYKEMRNIKYLGWILLRPSARERGDRWIF